MNNNKFGKAVAVGVGAVCVGAVGFMGIYLPFYSSFTKEGEDARRTLHQTRAKVPGGEDTEQSPTLGGMWANIEKAKKNK